MRVTIPILKCDVCKSNIIEGELWIDCGTNGSEFHWRCLKAISALEFIVIVHESGDQMWVRDSLESDTPYAVELKHLGWKTNPDNLKNILSAYRASISL